MTPREFVDQELKVIRMLFERVHTVEAMIVMVKNEERHAMPFALTTALQKEFMSYIIRDVVEEVAPDVVIFMSEAWVVKIPKEQLDNPPIPREHPNRTEVLSLQIEFKTGEKFSCFADITRPGKDPVLGEFSVSTDPRSIGRFMDFFPPKTQN